ncbi:MAG: hypothetical protein ACLQPD_24115 [Desulfomonilaceae bacterium]
MRQGKLIGLLQTGRHISKVRSQQGIRLSEMAHLAGYRNLNHGVRRLHVFESEGIITKELLDKIVEVLGLSDEDLKRLIEQDRQELRRRFEDWLSKLEPPHLIIRLIPGIYQRSRVPDAVPRDRVEEYASVIAAQEHKKTCLVLNRRESVWFDEYGRFKFRQKATPDNPLHHPYMTCDFYDRQRKRQTRRNVRL